MPDYPVIPEKITVHIGKPDEDGLNVTETFSSYIKNVASSEIYPTWPKESIIANVLSQISVAMNRVYTEYYPSRNYPFDITSSTEFDQKYIYQRDVFDSLAEIVDEIFDSYLRKGNNVEPLFAQFCDGVKVVCNGLAQWGTVELAKRGNTAEEILQSYFGEDVNIVRNVPIENVVSSAPAVPLKFGDAGRDVELFQRRLNRISANFPGIPKIYPADGFFDKSTTDAVKVFQSIFGLEEDGIVGKQTWYQILIVYNAVKNITNLNSEGIKQSDLQTQFAAELKIGVQVPGVLVLQYYLNYIAAFIPSVQTVAIDGDFGEQTKNGVVSFQRTYNLPQTGVVDRTVWDTMQNVYYGLVSSLDYVYSPGNILPFPGRILTNGTQGDDVRVLQEYLRYISDKIPQIPLVDADGVFGNQTEASIRAFEEYFGLLDSAGRVNAYTWDAIVSVYEDLFTGNTVQDGQFPGYIIS